jgi:chemotaxis protein methyltransferase CheR
MCMLAHLPRAEGWSVEVLGTDLSTRALAVAREATWSIEGAASIPAEHRRRFMLQGTGSQQGRMRAGDELRSVIRFERANLSDERYEHSGPFDVILCRNVLIYFGELARSATLRRIAGHLGPGGYLLLGHAESPGRALADLDLVQATVYRAPTNRPRATP